MSEEVRSKQNSSKPSVYDYHDYRNFLKDWLDYLKSSQSFSLRRLGKNAGVSASFLSMVIKGKRNMGHAMLNQISPHLNLSASELSFFNQLIIIADSEDNKERLEALKRLQQFKEYKKSGSGDIEAYKYLTKWYYVAIREMTALEDFQLNPKWIQQRLRKKVSIKEIKKAIEFLVGQGYISINGNRVSKPGKHLNCTEGVYKISLSEFHRQMFELAGESMTQVARKDRRILGHTVAIGTNKLEEAHKILSEAFQKLSELDNSETAEQVYHFGLLSFPVTKSEIK